MENIFKFFEKERKDNVNNSVQGIVFLKKSVRFNSRVSVYLIPTIIDYFDIKHILWYNDCDYDKFRKDSYKLRLRNNLLSYE